jgi:hypothetical protein
MSYVLTCFIEELLIISQQILLLLSPNKSSQQILLLSGVTFLNYSLVPSPPEVPSPVGLSELRIVRIKRTAQYTTGFPEAINLAKKKLLTRPPRRCPLYLRFPKNRREIR